MPGLRLRAAGLHETLRYLLRDPPEHPVGYAGMQMDPSINRRAKPVLERDRTRPQVGLGRRVTVA